MSREDFNSQTDLLLGTKFDVHLRDAIYAWITVNVKNACDKQKEICLKAWGNADMKDEAEAIRSAPYPEGIK